MFSYKLCVTLTLLGIVHAQCVTTGWGKPNDNIQKRSQCTFDEFYINGISRLHLRSYTEWNFLDEINCCKVENGSFDLNIIEEWTHFYEDGVYRWYHCPSGFFLRGFLTKKEIMRNANMIKYAICAKNARFPFYYRDCYVESSGYNKKGHFYCRTNYFITAYYQTVIDRVYYMDQIYCCQPENMHDEVISSDELKEKIMDTTLTSFANLAYTLGYACGHGIKGYYVGDDFYRKGDSWVTETKSKYFKELNCSLEIEYSRWSLAVKEIIYGEKVLDQLEPEAVHTGVEYNHLNTSSTKTFEYSKDVSESIKHSTESTWTGSAEMSVSLDFGIKGLDGASLSYKTTYSETSTSTDEKNKINTVTLKTITKHEIPPYSAAQYTVMVSKTRTTIPYTALVIARFNVKFTGHLKEGDIDSKKQCNYHSEHKGNKNIPIVSYTFGDQYEPFYAALEREKETSTLPWVWHEFASNPDAKKLIDGLTNEYQYVVKLNGKLEQVAGSNIDIIWDKKKMNRRSISEGSKFKKICQNNVLIAEADPNAKPAEVQYPKVDLPKARQFQPKHIHPE